MFLNLLFKNNKLRYALYVIVAQGLFVLCNLYTNHWINKYWNIEGFAIFNLVKRISAFIIYPLLIGTGIGIPRYISFLKGEVRVRSYEYLLSGMLIFLGAFTLFTLFILAFPSVLLKAFEETSINKEKILFSVLIFVFSQGIYVLLNAYYRGRLQFGLMSILNITVMSLFPLFALFSVSNVFTYFYCYSIATLILVTGVVIYKWAINSVSLKRIKYKSIRLVRYGYPRILAELGLFSIEFMPVFLTSLFIGLSESGYISMTFILLKLAYMAYEVLGAILLPYFGKLFKSQPKELFVAKVNQLLILGVVSSLIIMICFYFFIPIAIHTFFPSLAATIFPTQMVLSIFPVFVVYLLLRNVLDVVMEKAYNSINLSISAIVQLLVLGIGIYFKNHVIYAIMSIAVPYLILGILTYLIWINMKKTLITAQQSV